MQKLMQSLTYVNKQPNATTTKPMTGSHKYKSTQTIWTGLQIRL